MAASAKVIVDSTAPHGGRITTLQLHYPRIIHQELLTHRNFSRSSSSSRAVPAKRVRELVEYDPFIPEHWPKNQAGMQSSENLGVEESEAARFIWCEALVSAIKAHEQLEKLGTHKQILNRLLEPFSYIDVVLTSTTFENFFALRGHPAAQPEMRDLARAMREAIDASTPQPLNIGEWHLPYVPEAPMCEDQALMCKLSTARCARVSYLKHDGTPASHEEDLALYERLVGSTPKHASPCEHQATPLPEPDQRSRNFQGWRQYRELVEQQ